MIPAYLSPLANHLWQSTLFAAAAALLTLAMRNNRAAVRYGLWLAASAKFLIPFSLLVAVGSQFEWCTAAVIAPASLSAGIDHVFAPRAFQEAAQAAASAASPIPAVILAVWALGFAAVLFSWWRDWKPIRAALRRATPLHLCAPGLAATLDVRSSADLVEPAIVGVRRPVLLLPDGITDHLQPSELQAILAHELCHLRRRDNLAAMMHMLVEALFWFHPLVWWLETRLVDERERACDEEVLQSGNDPTVYAESILKICRLYAQSSLVCASGVSGASLKHRVERIIENAKLIRLSRTKLSLLAISGAATFLVPMAAGLLTPRPASALAQSVASVPGSRTTAIPAIEVIAEPKQVPFNAADFDKFVGYYRHSAPAVFGHLFHNGDHYYWQLTGEQRPVEFFPESPTKFFVAGAPAEISFVAGPEGQATEMISSIVIDGRINTHLSGRWPRSSKAEYDAAEAALQRRMKENVPSPGTEAFVRRWIQSEERGDTNYGDMVKEIADVARARAPQNEQNFRALGAFKALTFVRVTANGANVFEGSFANGNAGFYVAPLTPDGKVEGWSWRLLGHAHQPNK